jgi:hypothetical protein
MEGNERDGKQLAGQKKKNTEAFPYGALVCYVQANDQWELAQSSSVRPFGFCGDTTVLTQTTNNLTGVVTTTKGTAATDTHTSIITRGHMHTKAGGAIPAGEYVMPDATDPTTEVIVWNGTSGKAIVGRYIRNLTQWTVTTDQSLLLPAAADNDDIIIELTDDLPETGTGA